MPKEESGEPKKEEGSSGEELPETLQLVLKLRAARSAAQFGPNKEQHAAQQRNAGRLWNGGIDLCIAAHHTGTGCTGEGDSYPDRIRVSSDSAAELVDAPGSRTRKGPTTGDQGTAGSAWRGIGRTVPARTEPGRTDVVVVATPGRIRKRAAGESRIAVVDELERRRSDRLVEPVGHRLNNDSAGIGDTTHI